MRSWGRWKALAGMVVAGAMLPSCVADLKDGAVTGLIDAVSSIVSDSLVKVFNVPDALPSVFPAAQ